MLWETVWMTLRSRNPRPAARVPYRSKQKLADAPVTAELFNVEQLGSYARELASKHQITKSHGPSQLLRQLAVNESILVDTYELTTTTAPGGRRANLAVEWLLDNFHLIKEQITIARRHLPPGYSRQLPQLQNGPHAGYPRVYDIALELIRHTDGRVDEENLGAFVSAYQSVKPLQLGELWAVPIMLRLAVIENIKDVATHLAGRRRQREVAANWADRMLAVAEHDSQRLPDLLADMARSNPPFTSPFVQEFYGRLQGQSPAVAFVLGWVEHQLGEQGLTTEHLLRADSQSLAADQVSIGNSIASLRFIGAVEWRVFVEKQSFVEQVLRRDPAGVYGDMAFETRDRYRHCIEEMARHSPLTEEDVANRAIQITASAADREGSNSRMAHVGFYLIDKGRPSLERAIQLRPSVKQVIARTARRFPLFCYLISLLFLTAATTASVMVHVSRFGGIDWRLWLLAFVSMLVVSQTVISVINLLATVLVPPRTVPRMDFSSGIPAAYRTMVVVPTLLTGAEAISQLIEDIEIRYLGNRDQNLLFALLTDFPDANEETRPEDAELLNLARQGIQTLNKKYGKDATTVFYLFHRPRVYNAHERLWMGYERKRGKLEQLNSLLRGGTRQPFSEIIGDISILPTIRFVITLDTDTQLPRGTAHKLVGTLAHPLNRPQIDPHTGRVVEGYAILQPRAVVGLLAASRSRFSSLSAGEVGLDPYTHEVSDVYQDVFAEGSYVGKGIYDVEAFHHAVGGRFPENLILSHDLVESGYARSAMVGSVELFEDHPASYLVDTSRRHRWIRGDWQIASWLRARVPTLKGKREANGLTRLARWKIFDNLRRSLVPPAMLLLLFFGWRFAPEPLGFWTSLTIALVIFPTVVAAVLEFTRKPRDRTWRIHLNAAANSTGRQLALAILTLTMLPYRAIINIEAILSSGVRMLFTRRGLLIWHTRENDRRNARKTLAEFHQEIWIAPVLSMVAALLLGTSSPEELLVSGPLLFLWLVAPSVAWWISQPLPVKTSVLTEDQRAFLRLTARQTWRYFEAFVSATDNWLPPDNFQEIPVPTIASRTSPTNIGMTLLANLAAYDFGYITLGQLLDRTDKTVSAMEKLEHYRGHLYNWYDTRTLKVLPAYYISTVDSGNLAGALFTLRAGLWELKTHPVFSVSIFDGLADTFTVLSSLKDFPTAWGHVRQKFSSTLSTPAAFLDQLQELARDAAGLIAALPAGAGEELKGWAQAFDQQCREAVTYVSSLLPDIRSLKTIPTLPELAQVAVGGNPAAEYLKRIDGLAQRCSEQAEMDFTFLYDASRDLLSIGYNVTDRRMDSSYYDLLASEARLASFLLIAQDQLPQEHWFALGRQFIGTDGDLALLSWSGTMFEYLMPILLMPTYAGTLLDQTYRAVVKRQIEYGNQHKVPWGVSESCYNATDAAGIYQYGPFGVPGLGLKRGLGEDLVIAPYASALALMVAPHEACQNLELLAKEGYRGAYGFYEAIDFTPARLPPGKTGVVVRGFMVHHQGMALLSVAHALLDCPMQRRFFSDPYIKATDLLLHERIPHAEASLQPHALEVRSRGKAFAEREPVMRVFKTPDTPIPQPHLLSNGRYHVMATNAGGGYSRWKGLAVTRWREDCTRDCWGTFCYLRDTASGQFWSTAYQPTLRSSKSYESIFVPGRAEYRRRDEEIDTHTEVSVSPEDDVEVRRVTMTNFSSVTRTIELTSYAEVVLAPQSADLAHPAFSNLFVQTEILAGRNAVLCMRRPRSPSETVPWMFHLMTTQGSPEGETSFETDRAKFIGRGRTVANPQAFDQVAALSNSAGPVLDPIVAARHAVTIDPDTSANVHFITGMAETRDAALALIDKYRDPSFAARAFEMAWSHSQVVLRSLRATETDAQLFGRLAASVLYANPIHRINASIIARNHRGQSGLWGFGISGDLPIVLLRIGDVNRLDFVRQIIQAHAYWRAKGLDVDLVILNEDFSGYRQALQDRILSVIAAGQEAHLLDKPGGIFLRRSEQFSDEDRVLLQAVARVVLTDSSESLAEQVERRAPAERKVPRLAHTRSIVAERPPPRPPRELVFFNSLGGFTPDGREYVITLAPGQFTPAPWANVVASAQIGTVISESGGAYTWVDNAHEFRLTPWHNDPLCDTSGEAFYIRDEETGQFWSPTPLPARASGSYVCRHGFGYSIFECAESGIESELCTYVAMDAPVKLMTVKLRNRSGRKRRMSVTGYWELVLGELRHANLMHVITDIDPSTGALCARNAYNRDFAEKVVFVTVSEATRTFTGSRREFLGRNGTLGNPAAMQFSQLSGRTGAGLDPCAALQVPFDLAAGEERELVFVLGAGRNTEEAQQLVRRFGNGAGAGRALNGVWEFWKRTLGVVYMETPDPALNILANGWLEYQALACRYGGRSGYYQSGGAYGFRDQLQDTVALIHAAPWSTREQLLRCAGRQFREGDVQHWWHPPTGRGVRTHFSDDYLWLPYAACQYVTATGDTGVLEERTPFLEGRPVNSDEESYYDLPQQSEQVGTLYEHCVRAIKYGLKFGEHGLPLMGCGDWNDGMNLVGQHGKGESVWLAFFLHYVLRQFAKLAQQKGDPAFADQCVEQAERLRLNIEQNAWDGSWYRRAYFDDGTPLGSATNAECQIDSISQSWAVLSAAGDPQRARTAMESVNERLVRRKDSLIQLLDPPFDKSALQPGYIKGYVPGVRENGGQYTHGAIWTVMAFAELGDSERAWELFSMLNPIRHASNPREVGIYKVEPYVVAADVYALPPHTGRGGWTWYTGSAGWMYRLIVETLLGFRLVVDKLTVNPRLPRTWGSFKIHYRYRETFYHILVKKGGMEDTITKRVTVDGVLWSDGVIPLVDDRREHQVEILVTGP
jgi:cyclic beta-1,2-glucan glucanotransferase